jgi:hypothetical protein
MYLSGRFCFKHLAVIYSGQHEWAGGNHARCTVHARTSTATRFI